MIEVKDTGIKSYHPDMDGDPLYTPNSDAPFLCIEPWSMLPGREGVIEELSKMADVCSVKPGESAENRWSISVF